ncbi:DUF418 domain-containing protein [Microcella daejeonensis]|uniref:DUF418 domain-containing protein n=1 Tax=Microcella daejeonensis TaxID=2994971 RepID=UPI00227101BC|nr:DUF418 domain-containing protein [Microcella daejeonensis]WAB84640.1 DUF418 domain-containing protein [Microcella daejeonensis]
MPFLALSNSGLTAESAATPLDRSVAFAIAALAQGKFYLLFAFLFGYSFSLILREDTRRARARYLRRLLGLLALGAAHAVLFFIGDILMSYAILGVALLLLVRRSARTLVITAAVSYAVGLIVLGLVVLDALGSGVSGAGIVLDVAGFDAALATGDFLEVARARAEVLPQALVFQVAINWFPAIALFAAGLAVGRTSILAEPQRFRRLWVVLLVIAVTAGLSLGVLSARLQVVSVDPSGVDQVLGVALGFGSAPLLTGGYLALLALTTRTRWAQGFAPAGRMSLTGYLGESMLLAAIFCGWGLGLFGQLPIALAALVAIAVWFALDVVAVLWLRRFRYGPFEYLLRWWSRGRRPSAA